MSSPAAFTTHVLGLDDLDQMRAMLGVFGEAVADVDTYCAAQPSQAYLQELLASDSFIAIAALDDGAVVGGLAAYELRKFERERSEIYLYDLAVADSHRRRGIATALIEELKRIASARGAWVVFVQADLGDDHAIELSLARGLCAPRWADGARSHG